MPYGNGSAVVGRREREGGICTDSKRKVSLAELWRAEVGEDTREGGRPFMSNGMGVEDGERTRIRSGEDIGGVGELGIERK